MGTDLRALRAALDPLQPPVDAAGYVEPADSASSRILQMFEFDSVGGQRFLLLGARGCGKSTELRKVASDLARRGIAVAPVDLAGSGVEIAHLSAADVLYLSSLAALKLVPKRQQPELFKALALAFAGKEAKALGTASEALERIAGFATLAGGTAVAVGAVAGAAPIIAAGAATGAAGIKLVGKHDVVDGDSPRGQRLREAAVAIARAARGSAGTPLCVLVDGLEMMNGTAIERFRELFATTELLAIDEWATVISAPPCAATASLPTPRFAQVVIHGASDSALLDLLRRRVAERFSDAGVQRIARLAGGHPRSAIEIARNVVTAALIRDRKAAAVTDDDLARGIAKSRHDLGDTLALQDQWATLAAVLTPKRELPATGIAQLLFADGRIVATRAEEGRLGAIFRVHPLLEDEVRARVREGLPAPAVADEGER